MFWNQSLAEVNSSTQKLAATSAPQAELFEILRTTKELPFVLGLQTDFGETQVSLTVLTDSSSGVGSVNNPAGSRHKHLLAYIAFIKLTMVDDSLQVVYLQRETNYADIMTKQPDLFTLKKLVKLAFTPFG